MYNFVVNYYNSTYISGYRGVYTINIVDVYVTGYSEANILLKEISLTF